MRDILLFSVKNLRVQGLRTFLTILGVIIGIAAIVAFVSVGDGLRVAIKSEFEKIGSDKIFIMPGSPNTIGLSGAAFATERLTERDVKTIKSMQCSENVVAYYSTIAEVEFGRQKEAIVVYTVPVEDNIRLLENIKSFKTESGRDLRPGDRYSAVLGNKVAYDIFSKDVKIRDKVRINGKPYRVVGIMEKVGGPDDLSILVPMKVADELGFNDNYNFIIVDAKESCDIDKFREDIIDKLKRARGKEDFKVQTSANLLSAFQSILAIVQAVFVGVAAISLFVGGIGIMNTMLMAVIERTREIGVMKAIGASNGRIMAIFLAESAAIGLVGGIIGIALGMGISALASLLINSLANYDFPLVFPVWGIVIALAFSMATGIISGLYPAMRAARMNPVDALRYE